MRGVFSSSRRIAAAGLLIIVLLAPSALASGTPADGSLWDEFVAWLFDESGSTAGADEDTFAVWMSRFNIPGG